MTIPTQLVLHALLTDPTQELYGVEIGTRPGYPAAPSTRSWLGWRPSAG